MSRLFGLLGAAALAVGCAQQSAAPRAPEQGDPDYFKVRDSMADEVYVTGDASRREWLDTVRRIYIAPPDTAQMQIIQPVGVTSGTDAAWTVTEEEREALRRLFEREMTRAMEADQAFHIVGSRDAAQAVLYARIIAIHPYQTRADADAGGSAGGAVTMSFALVDPADDHVAIRAIDSKSTDDVWAFHQLTDGRRALELIFDAWGHQLRRSLLFMQGRLDSVPTPVMLKRQ
jgi:hypothetical protein